MQSINSKQITSDDKTPEKLHLSKLIKLRCIAEGNNWILCPLLRERCINCYLHIDNNLQSICSWYSQNDKVYGIMWCGNTYNQNLIVHHLIHLHVNGYGGVVKKSNDLTFWLNLSTAFDFSKPCNIIGKHLDCTLQPIDKDKPLSNIKYPVTQFFTEGILLYFYLYMNSAYVHDIYLQSWNVTLIIYVCLKNKIKCYLGHIYVRHNDVPVSNIIASRKIVQMKTILYYPM